MRNTYLKKTIKLIILTICLLVCSISYSKQILTNEILFQNPPPWLSESRLQKITNKIQDKLEWRIRRVSCFYYSNTKEFKNLHQWGNKVQAFYSYRKKSIYLGPKVNTNNFEQIFGHELVHVILSQKYKSSVPKWLEEGLANYTAKHGLVNYKWLSKQRPADVTLMNHPKAFGENSRYHYQASLALVELISSRCSLPDLLQLSVGKKLTTYLKTYCEIKDINQEFQNWITKKSQKK